MAAEVSQEKIIQTKALLMRYKELKLTIEDYENYKEEIEATIYESEVTRRIEQDSLYADKTANAVLLAQRQKEAAEECAFFKKSIDRAITLISNDVEKEAVYLRFIKGMSFKELSYKISGLPKCSTAQRRMRRGIKSIASTLDEWGVLD